MYNRRNVGEKPERPQNFVRFWYNASLSQSELGAKRCFYRFQHDKAAIEYSLPSVALYLPVIKHPFN